MLTDAVLLDISQAQRQIDQLETELKRLSQPVKVPVDIEGGQAADELRRDFQGADAGVAELNAELAQTDRELDQVRTSADRAGRELDTAGRRGSVAFGALGTSIVGFVGALAAFEGFRILASGASAAIQAASNLEESLSKTNVVFGDFSENIQDFAKTAPEALGLSNAAALEATATFGNLFVALGLTQEEAAQLGPDIVQLASDLASFNNIEVAEAVEKLRAGLVGEAEPLRTLGVNINEAATSAKALELGLVGANGVVTDAAKVQARYALILEQTVTAQGDFARTADGVANRQRTLKASFQDLQAEIGKALLPAFEALIAAGPDLIALIEGVVPAVESAATSFSGFVETITPLLEKTTQITEGFGAFTDILGLMVAPGREVLEVLGAIVTLQFGELAGQLRESGNTIGELFDRLQDRGTIVELASALQSGVDPARAFADALGQVAAQNDITRATFDKLAGAAGLSNDEMIDILRNIRQQRDFFKGDAQAIAFVNDELERLLFLQQEFQRRQPGGNQQQDTVSTDVFGIIDQFTTGLAGIDDAVAAANLAAAQLDLQPILDAATDGAQAFVDLADTGTAAAEALRTEEGEIIEDLAGFLDDFAAELEARNEFQDNLTLLRALGFGDLAQVFEDAGLDAAQALVEAVHNPEKAAEGERLAEENARGQARKFDEVFRAELAAAILEQPVDIQLGTIQLGEIQGVLNIGPIGGGQGVGNILAGTGSVTVIQEFPQIVSPSTATDAIKQAVGTINRNIH